MPDVKELAKWLEEEVEFLKNNQDYVGGWYLLPNNLAAVVLWEDGWGDEVRDDAIQSAENPDWALCAGILVYNPSDTPDGWFMPWDSKTGDIICETTGISPTEDYDNLAKYLIQCFNEVKDCEIKSNGEVMDYDAQFEKEEPEAPKEDDDGLDTKIISINGKPVEEESLKEEKLHEDKEFHSSPYHDIIAKYFDYDSDFEFLDVVASILGRVNNFEDDEDIYQAIDDELIYTYDQWTVLEHYCTPQDANWEVAFESLMGDVFGVCATIAETNKIEKDESLKENFKGVEVKFDNGGDDALSSAFTEDDFDSKEEFENMKKHIGKKCVIIKDYGYSDEAVEDEFDVKFDDGYTLKHVSGALLYM